jgi:rhodanese-related sulfurtransferase
MSELTTENTFLVDVRDESEFQTEHDERSVNIPVGQIIAGKMETIKNSPKENVVFVCASGGRAELARVIAQDAIPNKKMYNFYEWTNLQKIK